jgi:hypothetical protein
METIQYGQGPLPFEISADAFYTEITPYLWPGHYGEWDDVGQEFTTWRLVSPSSWHVTLEILSPPLQAVVGATVRRLRFRCDLLHASQEFHVELRRSSQLSDPFPTHQWGTVHPPGLESKTHPELESKTHPELESKTHPELESKTHPELESKTHPELESKTHPELESKTHPESEQQTHPEQARVRAPMKGQLAVWRIHTSRT